jgi:dTDP-4-amino-4,6-dideoxygalactose transaminase
LGALGDAGAITTNDSAIARAARVLRDHGRKDKYEHGTFGANARMDTIQAAALLTKLRHLDRWNEARRAHARAYSAAFSNAPGVIPLTVAADAEHVFHQYVVRVSERDEIITALARVGISTGVHYPIPLHRQAPLAPSVRAADFPVAERLAGEVLSLPVYPELMPEQRQRVIEAVLEFAVEPV